MIRARAAGLKTQTRRIITASNSIVLDVDGATDWRKRWSWKFMAISGRPLKKGEGEEDFLSGTMDNPKGGREPGFTIYPRIQPGHRIWWKETHKVLSVGISSEQGPNYRVAYRADRDAGSYTTRTFPHPGFTSELDFLRNTEASETWKPSLLMARKFARFVDTVIAVRPERLQDISEEDAIAEGIRYDKDGCFWFVEPTKQDALPSITALTARECYFQLWVHLNGQQSYDSNPWVWVYTLQAPAKAGAPHQNHTSN